MSKTTATAASQQRKASLVASGQHVLAHPVHEGLPVAGRVEAPGPALDAQVWEHEGAQGVVQLLGVHLAAAGNQQEMSS